MRNELKIGLGLNTATLVLRQFFNVPELLLGFLFGLAIAYLVVGALPEKSYLALKQFKKIKKS